MEFDMVPVKETVYPIEDHLSAVYPIDDRKRNELCRQLLHLISRSVLSFKPSKSFASLDLMSEAQPKREAVEIDIVVSGGGLKGYFMSGCSHVLQHELAKQNVKIARIAGASAGAWCGLFMLTNLGTENWIESYYKCKERPEMNMHEAYEDIWPWVNSCMPENAWEICSGRLFISITEVTWFGFRNHMISEYANNRELFEACMASSAVPYISLSTMFRTYRGMWVVDGGLTNNTPVFKDNKRRQLVFRLGDVFYPIRFLISPQDRCIEALVVRGAMLMSKFLQGDPSDSFAWLNPATEEAAAVTQKPFAGWISWRRLSVMVTVVLLGSGVRVMINGRKISMCPHAWLSLFSFSKK